LVSLRRSVSGVWSLVVVVVRKRKRREVEEKHVCIVAGDEENVGWAQPQQDEERAGGLASGRTGYR